MPRRDPDPLVRWPSLDFSPLERSYYPDLRDLFLELLGYCQDEIVTQARSGEGYPHLVFVNAQGDPWVVGDFKLGDRYIADPESNRVLWRDKRRYVTGTTRYVLFVTPKYFQLRDPTGRVLQTLPPSLETTGSLRQKLSLISFAELVDAAETALRALKKRYGDRLKRLKNDKRYLTGAREETRRSILVRMEEYLGALRTLFGQYIPRFADQYGRKTQGKVGIPTPAYGKPSLLTLSLLSLPGCFSR